MRDDIRAAFRSLSSSKTFTIVALLVLALGIGASTAIFSVVDAVVLRGLPFDEHDRLVAVGQRRVPSPKDPVRSDRDPEAVSAAAPQNYADWAARQQVFESVAAVAGISFVLREAGAEAEDLRGQRVTAGFFDVLRVEPRLGRRFRLENETEGQHLVAVLSNDLWTRRFGADPNIVGKMIHLEGGPYEVIGVMAPGFRYPVGAVRQTELWVPYVVPADERVRNPQRVSIYLSAIARLKPGVSIAQAQANMNQIAAALTAEHPSWNKDSLIGVRPLRDHIVGARTRQWMLMLLGGVGIVLLIACANVANLLLAKASSREREVGIRAALGASRWHLIRQLMVESLVLSALGTVFAVLLAWWAVGLLRTSMPEGVPRIAAMAIDWRVLGAAAVLSVISGLLFGLVPALQLSRPDLAHALKEGGRGASTGGTRQLIRSTLVVVEVALAVVLLVGAALFIGSFRALVSIDPGFDPDDLLLASLVPPLTVTAGSVGGTGRPDHGPQVQAVVERVQQIPGVRYAGAIAGGTPLGGSMSITSFTIPGRIKLGDADANISIRTVTPQYHLAMGIPLKEGRYFEPTDRKGGTEVVIINESAARKHYPGESAVGKPMNVNGSRTIVGVVGDVYQSSLETEPTTEAYVPAGQGSVMFSELVIKTSGDPYAILPAVKAATAAALPNGLLRNPRTMGEVIARVTAQRRFNMLLIGLFGVLGLAISAVGIYGVMAYLVSLRTREIGVRMALGATRGTVVAMILRSATILVSLGLLAGGIGAWFLSTTAKSFLFKIDVNDPRAFAAAIGTLAIAALLASVIPARRAASVDPTTALRAE